MAAASVSSQNEAKFLQFQVGRNFDGKQFLPQEIVLLVGIILIVLFWRDVQLQVEIASPNRPWP